MCSDADFLYLLNLIAVTVDNLDKADWEMAFQHQAVVLLLSMTKKGADERRALQREVVSSSVNGGDVDCICVWIHKIYPSGSSLLSGASQCIQTINYPLLLSLLSFFLSVFLSFFLSALRQTQRASARQVTLMCSSGKKMCTFIMIHPLIHFKLFVSLAK